MTDLAEKRKIVAKTQSAPKKVAPKKVTAAKTAGSAIPAKVVGSVSRHSQKGADVRARILEAGLHTFAAHGFEGATMQEIADKVSIKLPLIVYHFRSKRKLWEAVVDQCSRRLIERTAEVRAISGSATEKLHRLLKMWVDLVIEDPEYHRILTLEGFIYNERLQWLCDTYMQQYFTYFCDLVGAAQKEGGVRKVDPIILRYAIIGIVSIPTVGAEYTLLTGRDAIQAKETRKAFAAIEQLVFVDAKLIELRERNRRGSRKG